MMRKMTTAMEKLRRGWHWVYIVGGTLVIAFGVAAAK